ncbi:type II toxin-antitoxin system RelE/ParE family toxin [Duganella sp. FT50W]|uniref:Type II toxin-antitoxin system RelE/ParE family toxin n=1 Tax=Duganella lactea TaxID=2692173 RepID=A0A6L8MQL6_9BURK|nr:type II toxin-antitoxin system RelE/ParE family toxin [Duganella lactea]MYM82858.1 type II toxin-antitoxin system RelE/ParE family toxin [Duganella lactea]
MITIIQTKVFQRWLTRLPDRNARLIINERLFRLSNGLSSDVEPVGEGVGELRIHYGPGYRVYFLKRGTAVIILLCGGNKSSQRRDIRRAKRLAQQWRKDHA